MPTQDTQRDASLTENDENEAPDLSRFKEENEWTFTVEGITFAGSEPTGEDADQRVAELVSATGDASLLYFRALNHLHDSPAIPEEDWREFTASSKARIASNHLDGFGIDDFLNPGEMEEIEEQMRAEASEVRDE